MRLGVGLSICDQRPASTVVASAPTDIDQLLLDGTNVAHYTTAEWPGFEHLLADRKYTVGTLRTPRAGRCWLFDGTDDIATASTALLTGTGDFTICAWLKASSVSTGHIAGNYATGNSGGVQFALNTGKLQLYLGSALVGSTTLSTNTWYHVAAVRQSGVVTIYLDAVVDGSGTRSNSITGSTNFSFGALTAGGERLSGKLRDLRVYNSAKTAAEILAIKNQADTPGTYDTTGLIAGYWCEEESGTTGYDWSGNGRHLTLTNITQSTFHAADTGVTYSDANVRGYRLSGSVYIPATSSTLAADGNALTVTGKCPQPGYAPQKVATFDGTNDYATLGAKLTSGTISSLTVSSWIYINSLAAAVTIAGEYLLTGNNRSWLIQLNTSGNLSVLHSNDGTASSTASYALGLVVNTWYHLAFTVSGSTFNVYINGYLVGTGSLSYSTLYNSAANFEIGGWNASGANSFNGRMADVRVYSNTKSAAEVLAIKRGTQDTTNLLGQWPMCEGPGSGNTNTTIYDVSGNGKHLTVTNATVSAFWANASTYDSCIPNHPLKYGYTVNGAGVIVPALLSGASDAAGNAIGQAAGGWASGLPNLNCLPYTNPLGVSVGLETSLDPTADRKTTSSSKRRRRNTSGRYDRFGARSTAMSDASSNAYFGD